MWPGVGPIRYVLAATLLLVCSPASGQKHPRKRMERAEILNLEEKWRAAQLAEDSAAMDKLLSDQFLGITAAGQVVTKAQQLDRMRTRELDITRLDISDTKIKISGNLAVVTSLAEIDGTAEGRPLTGAFRYTRVYQRDPGDGWKITNFEATHVGRSGGPAGTPQASAGAPRGSAPNSRPASREVSSSPQPPS